MFVTAVIKVKIVLTDYTIIGHHLLSSGRKSYHPKGFKIIAPVFTMVGLICSCILPDADA